MDAATIAKIIRHEGTARAIRVFNNEHRALSDYGYWFTLGTLWVHFSGQSDLNLWKRLFASDRPGRAACLMKPSELDHFMQMPDAITIYRAHRPGETDWIAYTLSPEIAAGFALKRGAESISEYLVQRHQVTALFLRRGEQEIIVLDRDRPVFVRSITVIPTMALEA